MKIHFATTLVDMRNGINGLRAVDEQTLKRDPMSGHLFVFVGRSKDKMKILFWDRNGFVLYSKRLEQGRFQMPVADEQRGHVEMDSAQLAMLLGLEGHLKTGQRRTPQNRTTAEAPDEWSMPARPRISYRASSGSFEAHS